ncbi:MAG: hypothetical protein U0271_03955 [Polyangiaceae bacterium]
MVHVSRGAANALLRTAAALAIFAVVPAAAPRTARAHDDAGARMPANVPAVAPEGEQAKAQVEKIKSDPKAAELAGDAITASEKAIVRAHGAKSSGDEKGSQLLSRVALAWAGAAASIVEAANKEAAADAAEEKLASLKERIERAKALLAETEARRMQLDTEVARAEAEAAKSQEDRQAAEQKRVDKNGKKPKKDAKDKDADKAKSKDKSKEKDKDKVKEKGGSPDGDVP